MDKVQEKFEAWSKMQGLRLERQKNMVGGDMGRYEFGPTQAAFEVWEDAWSEALKSVVVKIQKGTELNVLFDYDDVVRMLEQAGVRYE